MSITIENPTAEAAFAALQQLPPDEWEKLTRLIEQVNITPEDEAFYAASRVAATRFFEDERDES